MDGPAIADGQTIVDDEQSDTPDFRSVPEISSLLEFASVNHVRSHADYGKTANATRPPPFILSEPSVRQSGSETFFAFEEYEPFVSSADGELQKRGKSCRRQDIFSNSRSASRGSDNSSGGDVDLSSCNKSSQSAPFVPPISRSNSRMEKEFDPVSIRYSSGNLSFFHYLVKSCCRDQGQTEDKERLAEKSRRVQTFLSVPLEVEKVMALGTVQCADAFLYIFTVFPLRLCISLWQVVLLILRLILTPLFQRRRKSSSTSSRGNSPVTPRSLFPTTCICELIKGCFIFLGVWLFTYMDLSVMYHFLRGQAVVKLYIMFNMLEVADRLCSSFGQDILESLFWTASPRTKDKSGNSILPPRIGIVPQIITALLYWCIRWWSWCKLLR